GAVCADAFDFWWNAVEAVTIGQPDGEEVKQVLTRRSSLVVNKCETITPRVHPAAYGEIIGSAVGSEGSFTIRDPQILPLPGVDPFALLNSCVGARRHLGGPLMTFFKELRFRFDRCDKNRLMLLTSTVFANWVVRICWLCKVKVFSFNVVEHFCHQPHVNAMKGRICAEVFDFWWNAVEAATPRTD
ncbi:hypothetical protein PENTCL1PPCAC_8049, partial [Pristionchus entomophagus]